MKMIELYLTASGWVAKSDSFIAAFGCDVVQTAFTAAADAGFVLGRIKALNPDCRVSIRKTN